MSLYASPFIGTCAPVVSSHIDVCAPTLVSAPFYSTPLLSAPLYNGMAGRSIGHQMRHNRRLEKRLRRNGYYGGYW